jgi:flagellar hook protein FlgE
MADMVDMGDFSIPLEGLLRASSAYDTAADRINRGTTVAPSSSAQQDHVDLSSDMVNLVAAQNSFASNIESTRALDEMARSVLDIVG